MSSVGGPQASVSGLTHYPFFCPVCDGGRENGCLYCAGCGLVTAEQARGWPPEELRATPRPPGVMRRPCADCATRPGSPERDRDEDLAGVLRRDRPFWCHHGLARTPRGWEPQLEAAGGMMVGALMCAGWWEWFTTGVLPCEPYRDPDEREPSDGACGAYEGGGDAGRVDGPGPVPPVG